jgi:hypothetical protein
MRHMASVVVMLSLTLFSLGTSAQNSPAVHQHAQANMTDGSVHPELIPDSVAWRLYLVAISESQTAMPNDRARQHSYLRTAGLSNADILAAVPTLISFKTQYAALIDEYNQSSEVLNNSSDGLQLFLAKRDALVQSTRDALKAFVTPLGLGTLEAHVQKEKARMQVANTEAREAASMTKNKSKIMAVSFKSPARQGCQGLMTPEYSSYLTWSLDSNNVIYSTAVVDGSTIVHTSEYCSISPSVYHQASIKNTLGSVGGTYEYSPRTAPAGYISLSDAQDLPSVPSDVYNDSIVIYVGCSAIGQLYYFSLSQYIESAGTYDKATGPGTYDGTFGGNPVYIYNVKNYCSNGTPDYNPSSLSVNEPNAKTDTYFYATAILYRYSTTSNWSVLWPTGGATDFGSSDPNPSPACTHTGPQE